MNDAKLSDFSNEQLELLWLSLEHTQKAGLWKDKTEDYRLLKTQVLNAWHIVKQRETVNQN